MRTENSSLRITVGHHSASLMMITARLVMPDSDPWDKFFCPDIIPMKVFYSPSSGMVQYSILEKETAMLTVQQVRRVFEDNLEINFVIFP